jgi:hypothetical protein
MREKEGKKRSLVCSTQTVTSLPKHRFIKQRVGQLNPRQTKMHSFGYRANALLTFSLTILAFMCAIASLSDSLNSPSPSAQVQVSSLSQIYHSITVSIVFANSFFCVNVGFEY